MSNWLTRPGYVALFALVAAAVIGFIVVIIMLFFSGDGDGDEGGSSATPTIAQATPNGTATAPPPASTPESTATPTPAVFTDEFEALEAFVLNELDLPFAGVCPEPGEAIEPGVCFQQLFRSDELAAFFMNESGFDPLGEAIVMHDSSTGFWDVTYIEAPAAGAELEVGMDALVFGVGDCLVVRSEPSSESELVECAIDGTTREVLDGPERSGGVTWWRLQGLGWANEEFLAPAAE